jgi:hypothetical protein
MAAYNYTLNIQIQTPGGLLTVPLTATGDNNLEANLTIGAAAAAAETDLVIIEANMQALVLYQATGAAMTVAFYSGTGGAGGNTSRASIVLASGDPFIWVVNNGANPLSGNVGQVLVTSTPGGLLYLKVLQQT